MKVGFLGDDTDHGTRELREIYKGELAPISLHNMSCYLYAG
jgi:hypothetical protein